jgi:PilZ domain-containing protein
MPGRRSRRATLLTWRVVGVALKFPQGRSAHPKLEFGVPQSHNPILIAGRATPPRIREWPAYEERPVHPDPDGSRVVLKRMGDGRFQTMTENSPRKHSRHASEGRITVTVQRSEGKLSFWGLVANLSKTGVASTVVGNLSLGEIVTLRFSPTPKLPEVQVRARVSHQRGYYCGFEFLWLSDADRKTVEEACAELSRK